MWFRFLNVPVDQIFPIWANPVPNQFTSDVILGEVVHNCKEVLRPNHILFFGVLQIPVEYQPRNKERIETNFSFKIQKYMYIFIHREFYHVKKFLYSTSTTKVDCYLTSSHMVLVLAIPYNSFICSWGTTSTLYLFHILSQSSGDPPFCIPYLYTMDRMLGVTLLKQGYVMSIIKIDNSVLN